MSGEATGRAEALEEVAGRGPRGDSVGERAWQGAAATPLQGDGTKPVDSAGRAEHPEERSRAGQSPA